MKIHGVEESRSRLDKESLNETERWMRNVQYSDERAHLHGLQHECKVKMPMKLAQQNEDG